MSGHHDRDGLCDGHIHGIRVKEQSSRSEFWRVCWKKLRPCTVQEQAEEQDLSPKRMSLSLALYVPGDIRNCMSRFDFFALSERGLRTRNDDAYCSEQIGDYYVFAIADGLDGHPFGDIASMTAIDAIRDAVKNTPGSPRDRLVSGIRNADAEVRALSLQSPKHAALATKLVVCLIDEKMGCTVLDAGECGRDHRQTDHSQCKVEDDTIVGERMRRFF